MTNNTNTHTAPVALSLIEKLYGVVGAQVAYKVKDVLDRPILIESFALIPTPDHIRAGMENSDQEAPETVGVIGAQVDGQSAVIVSLSGALNDQMKSLTDYFPFVAPISLKEARSGRTYPQVAIG